MNGLMVGRIYFAQSNRKCHRIHGETRFSLLRVTRGVIGVQGRQDFACKESSKGFLSETTHRISLLALWAMSYMYLPTLDKLEQGILNRVKTQTVVIFSPENSFSVNVK